MTNLLILTLAALGFLAVLGAVVCGAWMCAMVVGAAMRLVLGVRPEPNTSRELADIEQLIRDTRRMAGLPPLR